jgi:hypothetical protein
MLGAGIGQSVSGLDDLGLWVRFPVRDFSLLHNVHTVSWAQSASYKMGTGGCFPQDKAAGA